MTASMITKISTTCSALAAVAVLAAPSQAQASCNNATINGAYASVANEWIGKTAPYTPLAAVRHTVFDGATGKFTSFGYVSNQTLGTVTYFTLDGTYTVAADCTIFGVIAADSNKIYQIRTDANTETIIFERVVSNQNTQ